MAFFQLALKARKVEKARLKYEDEKLRSIEISKGAKPRYTLRQRIRRKKIRCKRLIVECWEKLTSCPEDSWFHRKRVLLRTDGTFENYIVKSIVGFFGGIFLTYIIFLFFVFQLNFTLSSATMWCSVLGIIVTLGLAFSYRVRCAVFLLLPQFFSKRGRQALIAYAFILAITGPAKNTLHNTGVLSESLACVQEQLKDAVKAVMDMIKQPFRALGDAISKVIKTMKSVLKKIKQTLVAIKRIVLSILRVIKSVFEWLGSVVNICNKKLGTPFDRCQRVFEGAVADCKAKLGPIFGGICNITYIVDAVCYVVKPLDFICMLVSYMADTVIGSVRRKIKTFAKQMKAMFYVKVKFSRSYHFETNKSRSFDDITTGIATDIRSRADQFLAVFDWMSFVTSFFMLYMLLRVIYYRHKWLTSERYDNRYLTEDLRTIDLIRAGQDKETVLPLNRRERNKYIPLTSIRLIKMEKVKLAKSVIFLGLTTVKLCIHMMVDYSLYWILSRIRYYGRFETKVQRPNSVGVYVAGNGYLAELYRSIVKTFSPSVDETKIDSIPCLPDPIPPDLDRYAQIVVLIFISWIMALFEPYGLRLRTVVMCYYHPDRAKQRATWLYNHIIRSRGSFLKYARRQLRRKFGITDGEKIERVTLRDRFEAICPLLRKIFPRKERACLLCGNVERNKDTPHVKCPTPGCVGLFCIQCFADLQNLCTICRSPMEYGDLSDFSEERDSSEDQFPVKIRKQKIVDKQSKAIIQKDAGEQFDRESEETEESSSESTYSYTYQYEPPVEPQVIPARVPFKDVEAQTIRDDVTVQIFHEPFEEDSLSSSESPTSCFVVRAHRKLRSKLRRKPQRLPPRRYHDDDLSSTTSIAGTDFFPTEEVTEDEMMRIEVDGDAREALLSGGVCRSKKQSKMKQIVSALGRIPWLRGESYHDGRMRRTLKKRRSSLLDRIVCILRRKKRTSPEHTRKRIRRFRDQATSRASSSSLSSSTGDDENHALFHDRGTNTGRRIRDRKQHVCCDEDTEDDIYSKSYKSHTHRPRINRGTKLRSPKRENMDLQYAHEKQFRTKQLPSYVEPLVKDTSYREINETDDNRLIPKCVREEDGINALSHATTSSDGRNAASWNITEHDNLQDLCACDTETTAPSNIDRAVELTSMSTAKERTNDSSVTLSNTAETTELSEVTENIGRTEESSQNGNTSRNSEEDLSDNSASTVTRKSRTNTHDSERIGYVTSNSSLTRNAAEEFSSGTEETWSSPEGIITSRGRGGSDNAETVELSSATESPRGMMRTIERPEVYDSSADLNLYEPQYRKKGTAQDVGAKGFHYGKERKIEIMDENASRTNETAGSWALQETQTEDDNSEFMTRTDSDKSKSTQSRDKRYKTRNREDKKKRKDEEITITYRSEKSVKKVHDCGRQGSRMQTRSGQKRGGRIRVKCRHVIQSRPYNIRRKLEEEDASKAKDHVHEYRSGAPHCALKYGHRYHDASARRLRHTTGEEQRDRRKHLMLKNYLPVYQKPELIEELKRHDKVKLMHERETGHQFRTETDDDEFSDGSALRHSAESSCAEEEERLPYQETEAFRRVVNEFKDITSSRKERPEDVEPLISISKRADKTKEVKQLFPFPEMKRRSSIISRLASRVTNTLKSIGYHKNEDADDDGKYSEHAEVRDAKRGQGEKDPGNKLSTASCRCVPKEHPQDDSTDDYTTDNNEITE